MREEEEEHVEWALKWAGLVVLGVAAATAGVLYLARDQMARHRRDLFSPHPLRRLAALGYMRSHPPQPEDVTLLRDFLAWEERPLLRKRAAGVLRSLERSLEAEGEAVS